MAIAELETSFKPPSRENSSRGRRRGIRKEGNTTVCFWEEAFQSLMHCTCVRSEATPSLSLSPSLCLSLSLRLSVSLSLSLDFSYPQASETENRTGEGENKNNTNDVFFLIYYVTKDLIFFKTFTLRVKKESTRQWLTSSPLPLCPLGCRGHTVQIAQYTMCLPQKP